jgi:hypothetical protein
MKENGFHLFKRSFLYFFYSTQESMSAFTLIAKYLPQGLKGLSSVLRT